MEDDMEEEMRDRENRDARFPIEQEQLLATLARIFAAEGAAREVALLADAQAELNITDVQSDGWGSDNYYFYSLHLQIPMRIYSQVAAEQPSYEQNLLERIKRLLQPYPRHALTEVFITPTLTASEDWRDKARAWVNGSGVTNQGRVRSDNIASRSFEGLLFRSQPEIFLFQALKAVGVSFAPLPVFVRGGASYRRIEPDFVILKDGIVMVVEVDGDTVHQETPAEAHDRTTMLVHEGAHVERVKASECETAELAATCVKKLLRVFDKLKAAR